MKTAGWRADVQLRCFRLLFHQRCSCVSRGPAICAGRWYPLHAAQHSVPARTPL